MLQASFETSLSTFHLNLQFSAEAGQTTVLLGESGAGKSTVLKLIAGLLTPERGYLSLKDVVYFDHEHKLALPPYERPFGYVFQDYVLFPHLTVFENVAFGLRAQRLPARIVRQRVGEALEQARLPGLETRRPAQLSGGQQQRVAIARALALQPQLLLLDEPLSALDAQTRREVRQELRRLLSNLHITTLLVTHQYLEALLFGDQILVLDQGQVLQQGTQQMLVQNPRSAYVAELVGTNFFRGQLVRRAGQTLCTIQIPGVREAQVEIQAGIEERNKTEIRPLIGEDAYVVVDPRSITIHQSPPEGSARNVFAGEIVQIVQIAQRGNGIDEDGRVRLNLLLAPSALPLIAEVTTSSVAQMQLREGQTVYAAFKATEARAYT